MNKAQYFLLSGAIGLVAALNFSFREYSGSYEAEMLKGASAYISKYDGENIKDPLEYVERTLHIVVDGGNETYKNYSELEKEIGKVRAEIGEVKNGSYYDPLLKSIGDKIKNNLPDRKLNLINWIGGVAGIFGSLSFLYSGLFTKGNGR